MTTYVLCGKPGRCCPVADIDYEKDLVTIKDDYGGKVKLTLEQYRRLKNLEKEG